MILASFIQGGPYYLDDVISPLVIEQQSPTNQPYIAICSKSNSNQVHMFQLI